MNTSPYVPFYTSDFLAGTSGMTAATKGVYITLISLIYEAEKPLAQSWDTLARRCGCTLPAFKKAVACLEDDGKVTLTDDGIWSDKCEKHIAQRRDRQESAKAAAETRWEKTKQKQGNTDATASIPQCQPEPEPDIKKEPKGSLQKKRGSRLPDDWFLPMDWGQWAVDDGYQRDQIKEEADRFKDYWIGAPGQKGVKLDWFATWRNWMRNSKQRKQQNGKSGYNRGTTGQQNRPDPALEQIARLAGIGPASGNGGG